MIDPGKAIDVTICVECTTHSSGKGFCNLRVTRRDGGEIVLDPHVAGSCVIVLDKTAAIALFDLLGAWLG